MWREVNVLDVVTSEHATLRQIWQIGTAKPRKNRMHVREFRRKSDTCVIVWLLLHFKSILVILVRNLNKPYSKFLKNKA